MWEAFDFYCRLFIAFVSWDEGYFAAAYLHEGIRCYRKGDMDRSIRRCTAAIKHRGKWADAYGARGCAYAGKGDHARAIEDYTRAIELQPDEAHAYHNRACAHLELGDFDSAIRDFSKAIELRPDSADAYFGRASAHFACGDCDLAIRDFSKAITLKPDHVAACVWRAATFFNSGEYDRAIQDYTRALELTPRALDDVYHRVLLFLARTHLGRDATADLADALKDMKEEDWHANVVRMLLGRITPDELLAAASDEDPATDKARKCEAFCYLGEFHLLRGETERAVEFFGRCEDAGLKIAAPYACARARLKRLAETHSRADAMERPEEWKGTA